jgi:hypothetical protein
MESRVPSQDNSCEVIFVVSVPGKVYVQVLRCSLVSVFAQMLQLIFILIQILSEGQAGIGWEVSKKCSFWCREALHIISG